MSDGANDQAFEALRHGDAESCDSCAAGTAEDLPAGDTGYAVQSRVRHAEWGDGIVMREEDDRLTVLFNQEGYRTLSLSAVRDNNLLTLQRTSD